VALGHIFEQSITDLERLRLSLQAADGARTFLSAATGSSTTAADKTAVRGKRLTSLDHHASGNSSAISKRSDNLSSGSSPAAT